VFRWFGELIAAIAAAIVGAFTLDPNLFMVGLQAIGSLLWQVVGQWGIWIRDAFVAAFTAVTTYVTEVFTSWGAMIYNAIFLPIVNAVSDAWNRVKELASGAWEGAKSFAGLGSSTQAGTGRDQLAANTVAPAQLAPAAMGAGRPNVQSNTNVTVTVPPGTTAEQSKFLQNAAQQSFEKGANDKLARDLAVYAP